MVKERLEILNTILGQRRFVAGDHLTIADFSIISSLTTPKAAGYSFDCYTNIKKWIEHMKEEAPYLVEVTKPGIEKLTALFQQKTR